MAGTTHTDTTRRVGLWVIRRYGDVAGPAVAGPAPRGELIEFLHQLNESERARPEGPGTPRSLYFLRPA